MKLWIFHFSKSLRDLNKKIKIKIKILKIKLWYHQTKQKGVNGNLIY